MHYIIIIFIIIVIVIFQCRFYLDTKSKIGLFKTIFPYNHDKYHLTKKLVEHIKEAPSPEIEQMIRNTDFYDFDKYYYYDIDEEENNTLYFRTNDAKNDLIEHIESDGKSITVDYHNTVLNKIINSINDYLQHNKTVSDFHLMKDIVDRNCDAVEDEINTQIPIPLYLGLVGTMSGILVGILYLWLSGSLKTLLTVGDNTGADGVTALLGGVALAMISSIIGILFTTIGSNRFKQAKFDVESNKHTFLSWIQINLLPILSENVVGAIREMVSNLSTFNDIFESNIDNLDEVLSKVNEGTRLQSELLISVRQIADKDISSKNIELYKSLKNSTEEIGKLAEYLNHCSAYLENVRLLNDKLDDQDQRTRVIEEMGNFFQMEIQQLDARKAIISKAVGTVDDYLSQALEKLKSNADLQFAELQKTTAKQQDLLSQRTQEMTKMLAELKQLSSVKESISKFEKAINAQNSKLDRLADSIHTLANVKIEGIRSLPSLPPFSTKARLKKIGIIGGCSLVGIVCFVLIIANWEYIYEFLLDCFKF